MSRFCSLLVLMSLCISGFAQEVKGTVQGGHHEFDLTKGVLYQVVAEGNGFRPAVDVKGAFLTFTGNFFQQKSRFQSNFLAQPATSRCEFS